ncbi:MAG: SPW repeat protein [Syntrophaceae bacterium]|nr:SPW repeat protein [Syntrophaceae bacterium]
MRNLIYLMVFQILVGIWLMVSPFVLGYREITSLTTNNMIFGAIVLILGIGVIYYQKLYPGIEQMTKKTV